MSRAFLLPSRDEYGSLAFYSTIPDTPPEGVVALHYSLASVSVSVEAAIWPSLVSVRPHFFLWDLAGVEKLLSKSACISRLLLSWFFR